MPETTLPASLQSAEFQLITACCTFGLPANVCARAVREALARKPSPERFRALVNQHGIDIIVSRALAGHETDPGFDPGLLDNPQNRRSRQLYTLTLHAELCRLRKSFAEAGVSLMPLKGTTLSEFLYGDATIRRMKDIDILVPPAQLEEAMRVMEKEGYTVELPPELRNTQQLKLVRKVFWHLQCFHPQRRIQVELHWRFERREQSECEPVWWLWPQCRETTTGRHYELLYLCLHGSVHGWQRLKWLSDILIFLDRVPEDQWPAIIGLAHQLRVGRILAQTLTLLQMIFATSLPDVAQQFIRQHGHHARKDISDAITLIAQDQDCQLGIVQRKLVGLRLKFLLNHRYSLPENTRYWLHFMAFNEEDILATHLPAHLVWFYPAVRVWRQVGRWKKDATRGQH